MSDPDVGVKERVRRSLNERIASAYAQARLPSSANPEPERRARLLEATSLGYSLTPSKRGRLRVLTPERPSITRHVQRLLGGDDLGTLLYSYLSAISHGTIWGLVQRAEPLDPTASGPVVAAGLVVSEKDIAMLAVALITAHITAFGGYAKLVGWEVPAWQAAVVRVAPLVTSYSSRYAGADM